MENSFKLLKNNQLTIKDELIYSLLSCYSNSEGVSNISRKCLAEKSGIKKLDTISKHTKKLEDLGLIKKTYTLKGGKRLAHYHVINPERDFMWVSNDVTKLSPGLIGFLIKLAGLRWSNTAEVRLSNNDIISKVNISKSTFYRNMDALLKEGIVNKTANGYTISTELFPVFDGWEQIQKLKGLLDTLAEGNEKFKDDRKYKTFYYYYNKGFEGLRMSPKRFAMELEAGTFFNNDKPLARNGKKEEKMVYYF